MLQKSTNSTSRSPRTSALSAARPAGLEWNGAYQPEDPET